MLKKMRAAKPVLFVGIAVGTGLYTAGWYGARRSAAEAEVRALPIVLRQVQSLGELHTARHTYENVFTYQTNRTPAAWAEPVPVLASLVRSSTRNEALVSTVGSVEAGIDMAKAQVESSGTEWIVRLPEPKLYEPVVRAEVHNARQGIFWRDDNLGLKAQADAGARFREASLKEGILETARASARKQVLALVDPLVEAPVRVEFGAL